MELTLGVLFIATWICLMNVRHHHPILWMGWLLSEMAIVIALLVFPLTTVIGVLWIIIRAVYFVIKMAVLSANRMAHHNDTRR